MFQKIVLLLFYLAFQFINFLPKNQEQNFNHQKVVFSNRTLDDLKYILHQAFFAEAPLSYQEIIYFFFKNLHQICSDKMSLYYKSNPKYRYSLLSHLYIFFHYLWNTQTILKP